MYKRRVGVLLLAFVSAAAGACASPAADRAPADDAAEMASSCTRLRDHLVELRLGGADADREQHRRALADALGPAFLASCEDGYAASAVTCALAATDTEAATECLTVE